MSPDLSLKRRTRIETYITAKDENRPHLMPRAFTQAAVLSMGVKTDTIAFPEQSIGLVRIADVLVRQFGARYENVYTFCVGQPPADDTDNKFICDWMVCMSEKSTGFGRFGWGSYEWRFAPDFDHLVDHLHITIEKMLVLPVAQADPVVNWASTLPYPWCDKTILLQHLPEIKELSAISSFLNRSNKN